MVKDPAGLPRRFARYGAAVVCLAGIGLVALIGALKGVRVQRLIPALLWGAVGCAALGWAVGHAAGRLCREILAEGEAGGPDGPEPQVRKEENEGKEEESVMQETAPAGLQSSEKVEEPPVEVS